MTMTGKKLMLIAFTAAALGLSVAPRLQAAGGKVVTKAVTETID